MRAAASHQALPDAVADVRTERPARPRSSIGECVCGRQLRSGSSVLDEASMPHRKAEQRPQDTTVVLTALQVLPSKPLDYGRIEEAEPLDSIGRELVTQHLGQLVPEPQGGGSDEAAFGRVEVGLGQPGPQRTAEKP